MTKTTRAVGMMSGTSMDGIDVAAIESDGERVTWLGPSTTVPYAAALRARLAAAIRAPDGDAAAIAVLERDLTDAHAVVLESFLPRLPADRRAVDLVGMHGHTLFHRPPVTRQLGDGPRLAARVGIDVVYDFRGADVAAGGEGAPFAPAYHAALTRAEAKPVALLNLGGVGNVTWLGTDTLLAFDTGPGNGLIDDWVQAHTGQTFDADGRIAATGRVDAGRLAALLAHPYFDRPPPKSLDRLDFSLDPVAGLSLADGAATLTAFTAHTVAAARRQLPEPPTRWLVTGGGRHNPTLMGLLADALAAPCEPIEAIGADGDAIEAQAFAFLAVRSVLGLPLSFPGTTGVPTPTCGGRLAHATRA